MSSRSSKLAKRKLVEPDYWTCPHGVRTRPEPALTFGPEVAELCAQANYAPDPQQELGLDLIFAIRPDGSPASFAGCVICARQNLKSGLFLQAVIGWLFVMDVPEIAWSAHELKTSLNAQTELDEILDSAALSKYRLPGKNRGVYDQNGKERIELNTGQSVWFQTRTINGGRGLGKPKVILDEAFKLKSRIVGALLPILLAQHHPQLLYGSSAPPLDVDAEQIRDVMKRGRGHMSPELWYLEWLAQREDCKDPDCQHPKDALVRGLDCALDREHLLLQANPTVHRDDQGRALDTGRITIRTLRGLRQELPPPEYMRECMSWEDLLDSAAGPPAIDAIQWGRLAAKDAPAPTTVTAVVDVEPDQSAATIGLASELGDQVLVLVHTDAGDDWVVDRLLAVKASTEAAGGKILEVALHPSGQANALRPAIEKAGFEVHALAHQDMAAGCSGFKSGVKDRKVAHVAQSELDTQIGLARTRKVKEATLWDRSNPKAPIGGVVAGSVAYQRWLRLNATTDTPPPPPRRTGSAHASSRSREPDLATAGF